MILGLLVSALSFYKLLLLGRVILSWVGGHQSGVGVFLREVTEPVLAPIRRMIGLVGMMDLSPIIAFFLIDVLIRVIVQ